MKNFSPEAAFAYADMVNNCVVTEAVEDFHEDFKKFMDAYENGNDEPAKVIHIEPKIATDATPEEIRDVVKSAFDKKYEEPKAGEVYRDIFGNRYLVAAVNKTWSDGTPLAEPFVVLVKLNDKTNMLDNAFTPKLKNFMNPQFVKVD